MDEVDMRLLELLQHNSNLSSAQLAEKVGLSVSATGERVRRLSATGAITANRAILAPEKVGVELCAFMFVDLAPSADEAAFLDKLHSWPEIQEAHHITGPHSWLLKVRVRNTAALQALLSTSLKTLDGVLSTETIVVLETAKETTAVQLARPSSAGGRD
jgi:Lrp/AsnC family leucine-responsive transcriptional regulator